jgi:hypothetical protein
VFSLYGLSVLCSVACIVHVIRTKQPSTWIWVLAVLFMFPFVGPLVYFGAIILPDLLGTRSGRRAVRGLRDTLNPEGELRRLEHEVKVTGDVGSRQRYADELVRLGRADEAVAVYKSCLTGLFEGDVEKALSEYATLAGYFPGAEAAVRYAKLLKRQGRSPEACQVLEGLLERARYAPSHYKRAQREWLDEAQAELRG